MRRGRPTVSRSPCFLQVCPPIQTSRDSSHENPRRPLAEWKFTVDLRNLLRPREQWSGQWKRKCTARCAAPCQKQRLVTSPRRGTEEIAEYFFFTHEESSKRQIYLFHTWEVFYLSAYYFNILYTLFLGIFSVRDWIIRVWVTFLQA